VSKLKNIKGFFNMKNYDSYKPARLASFLFTKMVIIPTVLLTLFAVVANKILNWMKDIKKKSLDLEDKEEKLDTREQQLEDEKQQLEDEKQQLETREQQLDTREEQLEIREQELETREKYLNALDEELEEHQQPGEDYIISTGMATSKGVKALSIGRVNYSNKDDWTTLTLGTHDNTYSFEVNSLTSMLALAGRNVDRDMMSIIKKKLEINPDNYHKPVIFVVIRATGVRIAWNEVIRSLILLVKHRQEKGITSPQIVLPIVLRRTEDTEAVIASKQFKIQGEDFIKLRNAAKEGLIFLNDNRDTYNPITITFKDTLIHRSSYNEGSLKELHDLLSQLQSAGEQQYRERMDGPQETSLTEEERKLAGDENPFVETRIMREYLGNQFISYGTFTDKIVFLGRGVNGNILLDVEAHLRMDPNTYSLPVTFVAIKPTARIDWNEVIPHLNSIVNERTKGICGKRKQLLVLIGLTRTDQSNATLFNGIYTIPSKLNAPFKKALAKNNFTLLDPSPLILMCHDSGIHALNITGNRNARRLEQIKRKLREEYMTQPDNEPSNDEGGISTAPWKPTRVVKN
jgi:hypothetical protein